MLWHFYNTLPIDQSTIYLHLTLQLEMLWHFYNTLPIDQSTIYLDCVIECSSLCLDGSLV
ncbi:hypothetical protein Syun_007077 [Stephania yunnanensis]|uniref:Uncharacterized protein n=1 Tax=Stephania yunnanensis TaxID=152371 RepID=A0AAP0Q223_9MAGN